MFKAPLAKGIFTFFAVIVFVPIGLGLLFLMPVEFLVSTWHLCRTTETTSGILSRSHVEVSRGKTRSVVEYVYAVDGRDYKSTRLLAGFICNRGFETGGGAFSQNHSVGTTVKVHYDPARPSFALIEYGWPKWSIGFSLGVWGFILGGSTRSSNILRREQAFKYAILRSIIWTGFLTLILMDTAIAPGELPIIALFYAGAFLVTLGYAALKLKRRKQSVVS